MGLALGAGASLVDAARVANKACGIVVGKVGTAVVYTGELIHALLSAELASAERKILTQAELTDQVARWRSKGATIGFTNGCFDLIHSGHVSLLSQAKESCTRLIVGLNDDASVRRLKGDGRPINNETARAVVLASLAHVDAVVLFEDDTPQASSSGCSGQGRRLHGGTGGRGRLRQELWGTRPFGQAHAREQHDAHHREDSGLKSWGGHAKSRSRW
jgi:cytidyltransferase-like protein